mgnify:FL=1
MQKVCRWIVNNMALFVLFAGVAGAVRPALLAWVGPWIAPLLGLVMFGMGMTLRVEDFQMILRRPWEVFLGALAQFTIMPLAAWGLAKAFALPSELAIGVVLVGTCPGGTASNVITYLARGDVALSVAMTMATTLLAPVVTPCLTWLIAGAWVEISLVKMMIAIAQMVLAPVLLGLMVNHFCGDFVKKCLPVLPLFSVTTIVLLVGGVVALSGSKILTYGPLIAAIVVLHNALGLACGYFFARLFHLSAAKTRAVAIEVGMQNSGLAASLAVLYFDPAAAIPGAIFSVWHNISGALVANYCQRRDQKAAADSEARPA